MEIARTAHVSSQGLTVPFAPTPGATPNALALAALAAPPAMPERVVLTKSAPVRDPGGSGITVDAPSLAEGEWTVDWARARKDAALVLSKIDFSQKDIFIWCSGTGGTALDAPVDKAIRAEWTHGGVTAVPLEYPSNWNLRSSVPTGVATLKLVLAEIERRGGNHRVMLSGVSQGAWLIGETMADPRWNSLVDRAVIMGHPYLARSQYLDGHDPKVEVVNHKGDIVTVPVNDYTSAMDVVEGALGTRREKLKSLPSALAGNLQLIPPLLRLAVMIIPGVMSVIGNPHEYGFEMPRIVRRLRLGTPLSSGRTSSLAAAA